MIAAWLLLMTQAAPARPAPGATVRAFELPVPPPPADWLSLPELPFRRRPDGAAGFSDFVRGEVRAGRCSAVKAADGAWTVQVDLAVLVAGPGPIRRIVPRAINCPTVEQYASGLVERLSRDNLDGGGGGEVWYHTAFAFAWRE